MEMMDNPCQKLLNKSLDSRTLRFETYSVELESKWFELHIGDTLCCWHHISEVLFSKSSLDFNLISMK